MAEKKYYWLKLPRNFFGKHYIKILRAKENGELLVLFYMWMLTEAIDHEGRLRYSEDMGGDEPPSNVRWCSMVARLSDTQEIIGSNPIRTTI